MILTKKITIRINAMNYKYYLSKGYNVLTDDGQMRRNEELTIVPSDAIYKTHGGPKVFVECDSCQKRFNTTIGTINLQLKRKNTCFCKNCQDSVNAKKRGSNNPTGGNRIKGKIITTELCSGGCNKEARYVTKSGKFWCNELSSSKCSGSHKKIVNTFKEKGHNIGEKNGMYGKKHSIDHKNHLSKVIKEKIKNGEFTPNITNSWANSKTFLQIGDRGYYFRSSWEAIFWLKNQTFKFEKLRIPYIDAKNKKRNYLVDFIDDNNKIIYEIKPKSEKEKSNNMLKFDVATKWAKENDYQFQIITEDWFKENLTQENISNFSKYGEKIVKGLKSLT